MKHPFDKMQWELEHTDTAENKAFVLLRELELMLGECTSMNQIEQIRYEIRVRSQTIADTFSVKDPDKFILY